MSAYCCIELDLFINIATDLRKIEVHIYIYIFLQKQCFMVFKMHTFLNSKPLFDKIYKVGACDLHLKLCV